MEISKLPTTVRNVQEWYEKSMVRNARGTKSPRMVRNVYGTNSLWYEKSGNHFSDGVGPKWHTKEKETYIMTFSLHLLCS